MNRYCYHEGLRGGVAGLVGRDQAVANALMLTSQECASLEVYLAFVNMEESGQCFVTANVLTSQCF